MRVRRFITGDEELVADLHNKSFSGYIESLPVVYGYNYITPEKVLKDVNSTDNEFWVIEHEGRVVGYLRCRVILEETVKTVWFVVEPKDLGQSCIAILERIRRRGFGRNLLQKVLNFYVKEGVEVAVALVYNDNEIGENFLNTLSFNKFDIFQMDSQSRPIANSTVFVRIDLTNPVQVPTVPGVLVRDACAKDAKVIAEIHAHNIWWCDECSTTEWSQRYIDGEFGHRVLVAELDGVAVAAMDYYTSNGRVGIAGVLPNFKHRGIGSMLYATLLNEMRESGHESAFIDSGMTQEEAIRMYERFGHHPERRQNCWVKILS